jgi:hypothetical protein
MARHKNVNWNLEECNPKPGGGYTLLIDRIHAALLMDIRDELQELNRILNCRNTRSIPGSLRRIAKNTEGKK